MQPEDIYGPQEYIEKCIREIREGSSNNVPYYSQELEKFFPKETVPAIVNRIIDSKVEEILPFT